MHFIPSGTATVGSDVQLYCNASRAALGNSRTGRFSLGIYDKKEMLNSCIAKMSSETVECTLDIKNASHSDAKLYLCKATIERVGGCALENKTLIVEGKGFLLSNFYLCFKIPLFKFQIYYRMYK